MIISDKAVLEYLTIEKPQLKQSLLALLEPTRNEEGCISYHLYENAENSNILTMIEKFKSKDAFDFHMQQPYLESFKNIAGELVDSADVTMCKNI